MNKKTPSKRVSKKDLDVDLKAFLDNKYEGKSLIFAVDTGERVEVLMRGHIKDKLLVKSFIDKVLDREIPSGVGW